MTARGIPPAAYAVRGFGGTPDLGTDWGIPSLSPKKGPGTRDWGTPPLKGPGTRDWDTPSPPKGPGTRDQSKLCTPSPYYGRTMWTLPSLIPRMRAVISEPCKEYVMNWWSPQKTASVIGTPLLLNRFCFNHSDVWCCEKTFFIISISTLHLHWRFSQCYQFCVLVKTLIVNVIISVPYIKIAHMHRGRKHN